MSMRMTKGTWVWIVWSLFGRRYMIINYVEHSIGAVGRMIAKRRELEGIKDSPLSTTIWTRFKQIREDIYRRANWAKSQHVDGEGQRRREDSPNEDADKDIGEDTGKDIG